MFDLEPAILTFSLFSFEKAIQEVKCFADQKNIKLIFPVKSFPEASILNTAAKYVSGFEVSNFEEYRMVRAEINASQELPTPIFLNSPFLNLQNWEQGPHVFPVLDSIDEISRFLEQSPHLEFFIRLDPMILGLNSHDRSSRFGVKVNQFTNPIFKKALTSEKFKGITLHTSLFSDHQFLILSSVKIFMRELPILSQRKLAINIGGGLRETNLNLLEKFFGLLRQCVGPEIALFCEFGQMMTQFSGSATAKILNWSKSDNEVHIVLNLSKLCHLQWSTVALHKGPLPIRLNGDLKVNYWGPTCSESDLIFSHRINEEDFSINFSKLNGSTCEFQGVSGYSYCWNKGFNGVQPAQVIFKNH